MAYPGMPSFCAENLKKIYDGRQIENHESALHFVATPKCCK